MKYNIVSAQTWPSWVFGFSGFQSAPQIKTTLPKGESDSIVWLIDFENAKTRFSGNERWRLPRKTHGGLFKVSMDNP